MMRIDTVTPPTTEPVTRAEAKLHASFDGTDLDSRFDRWITQAREHAEHLTEAAFARKTLKLSANDFPSGAIVLPYPPCISVTHVKYIDTAGVLQTLDSALYQLRIGRNAAWVEPVYGKTWPATLGYGDALQVTWVAGFAQADCPAAVKGWIEAVVAAMCAQREILAQADRVPKSVQFLDGLLDAYKVWGV